MTDPKPLPSTEEQTVWVPCIADGGTHPNWKAFVKVSDLRAALAGIPSPSTEETAALALINERITSRERDDSGVSQSLYAFKEARDAIARLVRERDQWKEVFDRTCDDLAVVKAELAGTKRMLAEAQDMIRQHVAPPMSWQSADYHRIYKAAHDAARQETK